MTDAETAAAIEALAHRLRSRDAAMNDGEDYADADVFALEFITAMRGYGWRHNETLAPPKPAPAVPPRSVSRLDELLAPVRAQMEAINAEKRAQREDGAA